ncbi:leucine-rich repeat-containing protein 70-like [Culicoides brevitarsis]|uniref:leucine-rich repeat-containing protein 70-like n=1 Tax=Culicoides brevitarsis TaxID=469753 RepID=UPI00307C84B9
MKREFLVIFSIFVLIYQTQAHCEPIWSFNCHKNENWTELKDDLPHKNVLKNVHITRGSLPIISLERDLCKYSSIEKLWIENVGLQSTTATALAKCTNLKVFKVVENVLRAGIHRDTFKQNSGLEEIWLQYNKISSLQEGTFNHLSNLQVLDLGVNELQYFTPDLVEGLKNLKLLALYSNNILELDGAKIYKNLPALGYVYFNDNPLKCGDLDKLIDSFGYVVVSTHADFVIERGYKVGYHRGFVCRKEEIERLEETTTEIIKETTTESVRYVTSESSNQQNIPPEFGRSATQ